MVRRRGPSPAESRFYLVSDLEDAIRELPEILGVAIFATEDAIEEVHITAKPGVKPKALVRNIETLLFVNFDIHLDHRKIGIVSSNRLPVPTLRRPLINAVRRVAVPGGADRVEVELQAADQIATGQCAVDAETDDIHAASLALIDAIAHLTGQRHRLQLREARLMAMDGHQIALVLLTWGAEGSSESFSGSALADADPLMATARATLDALNRRLVRLPLRAP